MGKSLKCAISWTAYIFCVILFGVGYLYPLIKLVIFKENSQTFIGWMNISSIGLSVVSLCLGVFSIVISSKDNKQAEYALNRIDTLQQEISCELKEIRIITDHIDKNQENMTSRAMDAFVKIATQKQSSWSIDHSGTKE